MFHNLIYSIHAALGDRTHLFLGHTRQSKLSDEEGSYQFSKLIAAASFCTRHPDPPLVRETLIEIATWRRLLKKWPLNSIYGHTAELLSKMHYPTPATHRQVLFFT